MYRDDIYKCLYFYKKSVLIQGKKFTNYYGSKLELDVTNT